MGSKIVASYLVRVTLREPEDDEGGSQAPPTNDELEAVVIAAIKGDKGVAFEVTASAERLDV